MKLHHHPGHDRHWWSDRVEMASDWLQRERLGGIALKRNQTWPGNTVSWRFAAPDAAEQVALLLPNATPGRFRVLAFNTSGQPQRATMTTWNVTAGRWRMTGADGARAVMLERSLGTDLTFAPGASTFDFELVAPIDPVETRADLGIGRDDVALKGRLLTLTVHSLGAQATKGGTATVIDARGTVVAHASIPPLAAPRALRPVTTTVQLALPRGQDASNLAIRVALPDDAAEVTTLNNAVSLPARER